MSHPRLVLAAACAAALVAVSARAEDLTLVFKTTHNGKTGTSTQYYSAQAMRTSDADSDTIIVYDPGKIVSIDHKKKEYSEITLAEMEEAMKQAAAKMQEASAKMQEQMASMPPEMRQKMEQMMGGVAGAVTVTKGGTKSVAGYPCQEYVLAMGPMTTHMWTTTDLKFPAPNVDYRKLAQFTGPAAAMANNPMFKSFGKATEEMKKIQGITLEETSAMKMMGRSMDTSKEATEVRKGAIDPSAFDVAALTQGYKKVPHPATKMGK
jgi:hypothetical protein